MTLGHTGRLQELVTKELEAGVNYIHGLDFQTSQFAKYRKLARELALKAAKEEADKMAGGLGQTAGPPFRSTRASADHPGGIFLAAGDGDADDIKVWLRTLSTTDAAKQVRFQTL